VFKNPIIDFNALFNSLGNSRYRSPEVVLAFLLYEGSTIHNASDQFVLSLKMIHTIAQTHATAWDLWSQFHDGWNASTPVF